MNKNNEEENCDFCKVDTYCTYNFIWIQLNCANWTTSIIEFLFVLFVYSWQEVEINTGKVFIVSIYLIKHPNNWKINKM